MHLCSFVHAVTLLETLLICIRLCSFGHAVALIEILIYMYSLILVWSCYDYWISCLYAYTYVVWSCSGSNGNLALNAFTYISLVMQ